MRGHFIYKWSHERNSQSYFVSFNYLTNKYTNDILNIFRIYSHSDKPQIKTCYSLFHYHSTLPCIVQKEEKNVAVKCCSYVAVNCTENSVLRTSLLDFLRIESKITVFDLRCSP